MSCHLSLKTIFSPSERSAFSSMYIAYDLELSQYFERPRADPVTLQSIEDMLNYHFLKKFFVLSDSGEEIGFLLVGFGENTHHLTDYYIAEFFIQPEYRRAGVGLAAIKELLSLYPGKYCYHILKNNIIARSFWDSVKNTCGCKELVLLDTTGLTDCNFFAFEI